MQNDIIEAASAFEDLMDDAGLMPGDDNFAGEEVEGESNALEAVTEALEEELENEDESDEDDSEDEETDEGAGEGDSDENTDEDDPDDETSKLFDIDIDGETYEVNLPELRAGYLRQEEFVKRSTALEQQHAEKMAELAQKEADLIKEIEATAVISAADLTAYDNFDWERLKAEDPAAYNAKRVEYIEKREAIQRQLTRRNQVQAMQQQAFNIKQKAYLDNQLEEVKRLIPEFVEDGYSAKMVKYAESIGIPEAEVLGIVDAKHLLLLDHARRYSESLVTRKGVIEKKVKADVPAVVKPSAKAPKASAGDKRQKALEANFAKTGTIEAAARAFEAFI